MSSSKAERVLIVEDDPGGREPLAVFLRRRGYNVEVAPTVAAGVAKLTPSVTHLILDLRLPDGPGIQLLERVREQNLPAKVAVVTGASSDELLANAVMMRPDAFLRKPVDFGDLLGWLEGGAAADLHPLLSAD
jgi:DNA-binding response OmpR family regulator